MKNILKLPRNKRINDAGVTVVEAIVAMSILAAVVAMGFASLIRSYTVAGEARNIDAARNMLNTLADQFLSMPYRDPANPFGDVILPICEETEGPTGEGIQIPASSANGPLGEDLDKDGFAGRVSTDGLVVTLHEGDHVEAPEDDQDSDPEQDDLRAVITREVEELQDGQLGPLLQATFTIEFESTLAPGSRVRKSLTVARAVVDQ